MIPFRDHNPSGTVPFVTVALIVVNAAVFLVELNQGPRLNAFIADYGLTPARVSGRGDAPPPTGLRGAVFGPQFRYTVPAWLTFFTSMFLHGGWMHLIGNMWYLWIFGDNVEDRMGHVKYLIFYLLCGLGAGGVQTVLHLGSWVPMVGASGAIAGVLGAYLVSFPRARVSTLLPLGIIFTVIELPAVIVLGFWFVIQFFSGMQSLSVQGAGGVAWWAHIGGFVLGVSLLFVFQKPRPKRRAYVYRPLSRL